MILQNKMTIESELNQLSLQCCSIPDCDNTNVEDFDGLGLYCSTDCALKDEIMFCPNCEQFHKGLFYWTPWAYPKYCCHACLTCIFLENFDESDFTLLRTHQ